MRTLLAYIGAVVLVVTVARAADDIMASRYGNTIVTTAANGVTNKMHYKADGTFDATQGAGTFSGTWKLDGKGVLCLTFVPSGSTCAPAVAHKVGDTWLANGDTISLVEGIQ